MITSHLMGVTFALISAAVWGTGDFSGGIATRRQNQFQVVFLMTIPGILLLAIIAPLVGEALLNFTDALWAVGSGFSGALGVAALYRGLARGSAAAVAPTAAVVGAAIPVLFSLFFVGVPAPTHMLGFVVAIAGIWCVSRPPDSKRRGSVEGLVLAVLAGAGFGGFFTMIAQVAEGLVFFPLVLSKIAALILAFGIIIMRRGQVPALNSNPIAILAGVFDAGGNVFFLLAKQYTRLDVAAVLASMYPSVTVILAALILREKVSVLQWTGVLFCVAAIALIGM